MAVEDGTTTSNVDAAVPPAVWEVVAEFARTASDDHFDPSAGLRYLGERLCHLIDMPQCWVFLCDGERVLRAGTDSEGGAGAAPGLGELARAMADDEITADIMQRRTPVCAVSANRFASPTMQLLVVPALLGIPLVAAERVIAIFFIGFDPNAHHMAPDQIALAHSFARMNAPAVRQALSLSLARDQARDAERQQLDLQRLVNTTDRLTRSILDGGDLVCLAETVVDAVGKPVLLHSSKYGDLIAWAAPTSLKGLREPPLLSEDALAIPWVADLFARASATGKAKLVPPVPDARSQTRRLLCPVKIKSDIVGHLEVVELGSALQPLDCHLIEQSADYFALAILAQHRRSEAQEIAKQDYLLDLVSGRLAAAEVRERGRLLDVYFDTHHALVRVCYSEVAGGRTGLKRRAATARFVRSSISGEATMLGTGVPGADLFLVCLGERGDNGELEAALRAFIEQSEGSEIESVIVSEPCQEPEDLPQISAELREIGSLLHSTGGPPRVVPSREFRFVRTLEGAYRVPELQERSRSLLQQIEADDDQNGSLLKTVVAYLENGTGIRATAGALGVHENTVRHRLRRLRDNSSIDVGDFRTLLELQLAVLAKQSSWLGGS